MSSPPCEVFEAIVYGGEELREPLLAKTEVSAVPITTTTTTTSSSSSISPSLKLLAFVTGSIVAGLSQCLLSEFLWDADILNQSNFKVVLFSLHWSFWTCLTVFSTMMLLVNALPQSLQNTIYNGTDEDAAFQLEGHYVVGALLAIAEVWILEDVLKQVHVQVKHPILLLVAAGTFYHILVVCTLSRNSDKKNKNKSSNVAVVEEVVRDDDSMLPTYSLIAGALGLVIGTSSQFTLSLVLWKDPAMTMPAIESVVLFSLVWSVLTVTLTGAGCLSLQFILFGTYKQQQRTLIRMEAVYVGTSLVGICTAWILIDCMHGMPEQVLPSVLMLLLSLLAFSLILYSFPEDKCLMVVEQEHQTVQDKSKPRVILTV